MFVVVFRSLLVLSLSFPLLNAVCLITICSTSSTVISLALTNAGVEGLGEL